MTESGSAQFDAVISTIGDAQAVDIRAVMVSDTTAWQLVHATVTVDGEDSPRPRTWRYRAVVFLERRVSGVVAAALMRGEPQELDGLKIQAPPARTSGLFQRLEARREWNYLAAPVPRTEWEFGSDESGTSHPWHSDVLVGDGPPFVSFEAAFSSFFFGAPPGNHANQRNLWRVIRYDRRAWLHRITIAPSSLTAIVKGTELDDVLLELSTPTSHLTRPVGRSRKVKMPLPSGLANHTLLVLRRDEDWLDLRHFSIPGPPRTSDPSIVWDQPGADLEVMIASGEGTHIEFKEQVPSQPSPRKNVLKTVTAFASGEGGTILFGVDDEAQVVGIDPTALDSLQLAIGSMIRDSIGPEPPLSLRTEQLDGKIVLLAEVAAGGQWFALNPHSKPEFYVRRGASTVPARMEEIVTGFARQSTTYAQHW